jgi:ribosomal protein L32E
MINSSGFCTITISNISRLAFSLINNLRHIISVALSIINRKKEKIILLSLSSNLTAQLPTKITCLLSISPHRVEENQTDID